jgi:hypothetical protein
MLPIRKHILTDENNHPVAVQIDYADWLEIEKTLAARSDDGAPAKGRSLNALRGSIRFTGDAVALQRAWRSEWR